METTMKSLLCTLVICFVAVASVAGQDGLALMKIESGARPAGMGGAFVSIAGDANGSFYNPAAAAGGEKFIASFGHNTYWTNVRLETGYFAKKIARSGWMHGGIRYAAVDDLESRLGPSAEPDALFQAHDISFKWGLAYKLTDKLMAGASLGWFIEKIDIYRGSAFNADFGLLYQLKKNLNIAASATNIGSDFALTIAGESGGAKISLPTTYRVGGSYTYDRYLGAADLVILDDDPHAHLGVEADLHEVLAIRAGYMTGYDAKDITAGASFVHRNFTIDYAFVPYSNDLGTSHLFNLTVTL